MWRSTEGASRGDPPCPRGRSQRSPRPLSSPGAWVQGLGGGSCQNSQRSVCPFSRAPGERRVCALTFSLPSRSPWRGERFASLWVCREEPVREAPSPSSPPRVVQGSLKTSPGRGRHRPQHLACFRVGPSGRRSLRSRRRSRRPERRCGSSPATRPLIRVSTAGGGGVGCLVLPLCGPQVRARRCERRNMAARKSPDGPGRLPLRKSHCQSKIVTIWGDFIMKTRARRHKTGSFKTLEGHVIA